MKLSVAYHGGTRYDITSGKHRIVTDQSIARRTRCRHEPVELFGALWLVGRFFIGQLCEKIRHLSRWIEGPGRNGRRPRHRTASG